MVKRSFLISEIKNTVHWSYVINDLSGEEIIGGNYYEKELQKANQEKFRIEKVIKRKGNKLYIKWKGYDKIFSSWVDKKKDMIKFLVVGLIKKDIVKWIYTKGVNTFLSHSNLLE